MKGYFGTRISDNMFQFIHPTNQDFMYGLQSNKNLHVWQIANQSSPWQSTSITCNLFNDATYHHILYDTHRVPGDTSCTGGVACEYFDSITVDGTNFPINMTMPSTALNPNWSSAIGNQFQPDSKNTGASSSTPVTVGVNVDYNEVVAGTTVASSGSTTTTVTENHGNLGSFDFDSTGTNGLIATGTPTLVTTGGVYTSPSAADFNAGTEFYTDTFAPQSTLYARFYVQVNTIGTTNARILDLYNGTAEIFNLFLSTSNFLNYFNAQANSGSGASTSALPTGSFTEVELQWTEGTTNGSATVKVNGTTVYSGTNLNTGSLAVNTIEFGQVNAASGWDIHLDSVDFGNTGFLGPVTINQTNALYDPAGAAQQAQANAEAFSANASNLASGTVPASLLPPIPLSTGVSGTLPAGNTAAITGDVTKAAGSFAATVTGVNGAALPVSAAYVGTNAAGAIVAAPTPSGGATLPASGIPFATSTTTSTAATSAQIAAVLNVSPTTPLVTALIPTIPLGTGVSGTLPATNSALITGDVTKAAGSSASTVTGVNGTAVPKSAAYVGTDANGAIIAASTPSGGVPSVFGRTGAVTAASGDYNASQVTNAADKSSASAQAFAGAVTAPSVSVGTSPSTSGVVNLPNSGTISARNGANTADEALISLNPSNFLQLGFGTSGVLFGSNQIVNSAGTATSGSNFNSLSLSWNASFWTGSAVSTAQWSTFENIGSGTTPFSLLTFNSPTGIGTVGVLFNNPSTATSGANFSSPSLQLQGDYWTGTTSAADKWTIVDSFGSGANPTSTLNISHSAGTSGAATVAVPSLTVGTGTALARYARFSATLTPASIASNTCTAQSFTVTGIAAGDILIAVSKPTEQAGLSSLPGHVSGANTTTVNFCNATASSITPTAAETYTFVVVQ
jgi:hypothetical protein